MVFKNFILTQNSDAQEIEESIHSVIRKRLWPEDVTFCCGHFHFNDMNKTVTYTTSVDYNTQKLKNEFNCGSDTIQLGKFLVKLTQDRDMCKNHP